MYSFWYVWIEDVHTYLIPIDTKINFIEGSVQKIYGGLQQPPLLRRVNKNSLVRRGLIIQNEECKHKGLVKLNSYSNASVFYRFVACAFPFFEVKSVLPIDRYQNAISNAISLHELKKVQLQERYTLLTQDSIGHLKTLCMSVLSLVVAMESEWQRDSSSQSDKKTLAF